MTEWGCFALHKNDRIVVQSIFEMRQNFTDVYGDFFVNRQENNKSCKSNVVQDLMALLNYLYYVLKQKKPKIFTPYVHN